MIRITSAAARRMGILGQKAEGRDSTSRRRPVRALPSPAPALPEPAGVVEIVVHGRPKAKESSRIGGQGRFYKPKGTQGFERLVCDEASLRMRGFGPFRGPVAIEILQYRRMPERFSEAQKAAALRGELLPDTKPDVDNLQKSLFDGLKTIVFEDDAQVCQQSFSKRFGEADRVIVRVFALPFCGIRRGSSTK